MSPDEPPVLPWSPDARSGEPVSIALAKRARLARRVAVEAGEILKDAYGEGLRAERKGEVDFVSRADRSSEDFLVGEVRRAFPEDRIWAEEGGGEIGGDGFGWCVDPLDGTTNFLHEVPHFAVSIGIVYQGLTAAGVVLDPMRGELFDAVGGGGAFLGGVRLRVSGASSLGDALLATGFPYDRRRRAPALLARVERAMMRAQGVRRCGAAALDLCWVAAGRFDGFWEEGLSPWDTCAGALLVMEAGGMLSDYSGGSQALRKPEIVASNGRIHQALLEEVVGSPSGRPFPDSEPGESGRWEAR